MSDYSLGRASKARKEGGGMRIRRILTSGKRRKDDNEDPKAGKDEEDYEDA